MKPWLTKAQETVDYSNVEAMYVDSMSVRQGMPIRKCTFLASRGVSCDAVSLRHFMFVT